MSTLRSFARRNWLPLAGLAGSQLVAWWFAVGVISDLVYFSDSQHQAPPLESWMTPRYVGLSWDLPRPVVAEIFGLDISEGPPQPGQRPRVGDLAQAQGLTLEEMTEKVRRTATALRAAPP